MSAPSTPPAAAVVPPQVTVPSTVDEDDDEAALLGAPAAAAPQQDERQQEGEDLLAAPADPQRQQESNVNEERTEGAVGFDVPAETPVAPAAPELPRCPLDARLSDIFGTFKPDVHATHVADPRLLDVLAVCHEIFGEAVTEHEIFRDLHLETDADDHREREICEHKRLDDIQPLLDVFGDTALDFFTEDLVAGGAGFEHARIVTCDLPANPFEKAIDNASTDELWVLDMHKVQPNRQVLHMQHVPFNKRDTVRPPNTARKFFTPQNCIQWAKNNTTGKIYSNARLVRWSDGSSTLHIGSDVYELPDKQEATLAMLAKQVKMANGEGTQDTNVYVECVPIQRHVSAMPAANLPSSVNEGLLREIIRSRAGKEPENSVSHIVETVPHVRTAKERNMSTTSNRTLTDEEKFIENERVKNDRLLQRNAKQGIPMTPMDMIQMELDALNTLVHATRGGSLQELLQTQQQDMIRSGLIGNKKSGDNNDKDARAPKSRFDRSTGVETADATQGAGAQGAAEDEYDFARKRSRSPSGDQDIGELLGERSMMGRPVDPSASTTAE